MPLWVRGRSNWYWEKGGRNRKKFHGYIYSVGEKKIDNNVKNLTSHICIVSHFSFILVHGLPGRLTRMMKGGKMAIGLSLMCIYRFNFLITFNPPLVFNYDDLPMCNLSM